MYQYEIDFLILYMCVWFSHMSRTLHSSRPSGSFVWTQTAQLCHDNYYLTDVSCRSQLLPEIYVPLSLLLLSHLYFIILIYLYFYFSVLYLLLVVQWARGDNQKRKNFREFHIHSNSDSKRAGFEILFLISKSCLRAKSKKYELISNVVPTL